VDLLFAVSGGDVEGDDDRGYQILRSTDTPVEYLTVKPHNKHLSHSLHTC